MLSTIPLVVAGLSSGHKIGLVVVAAAFIVFALVSSFVIPRRSPNFPGRAMPVYVTVCVLFFVAMMAAVLVFGKEAKEAEAGGEPPAKTSTQSSPAPAPAPTTTNGGGGGASAQGDAVAGKQVFTSAGCSGCHTLKDAGATGNVGPNLDQLKPDQPTVAHQVTDGGGGMPPFKGQLSPKQIQDVAAYVFKATHS
ncbi:MAG TPA: c-type cytochrome [Gaiellaceae bacterium]|jgi:mono/diheme cytochrome c family protein|nr:c-type cytochrome [Gaiellaceae bacterium]